MAHYFMLDMVGRRDERERFRLSTGSPVQGCGCDGGSGRACAAGLQRMGCIQGALYWRYPRRGCGELRPDGRVCSAGAERWRQGECGRMWNLAGQLDVGKAQLIEQELFFERLNALACFHGSGARDGTDQGLASRCFALFRAWRGHGVDPFHGRDTLAVRDLVWPPFIA